MSVFNGYRVSVLQDENEFCGQMVVMAAMVKMVNLMHILPQFKKEKASAPSVQRSARRGLQRKELRLPDSTWQRRLLSASCCG